MVRRHYVVFQVAPRFRAEIAGQDIGPGAALGFGVAGRLAGLARCTGRDLEIAIVAAGAINGELPHPVARLDDAGAMDAGCGGAVLQPRRHLALEPAHRRTIGGRIVEAPGPATGVAVAAGRAYGGIAGPDRKVCVVAPLAGATPPRARGPRPEKGKPNPQPQPQKKQKNSTPPSLP